MGKSAGPTVGLDIGSKFMKAVELVPGRNGPTVKALGIAPTPPGAMENNIIVDPKLLGDAVKKLLKESGISCRRSVSSVSGQGALVVRVIEVPKMSDAELAETMKWEVERHVPFAADEVIMDFQPVVRADDDPDAQNMEVLLAVAQQEMIDRHVAMLFAAGLSPGSIDVEPLAASRALIELGPEPYAKKTTAIVNLGAGNTDLGIYRDGVLAFPRTLPLAGDAMTAAIMQQMGLDEAQADETKCRSGEVLLGEATVQATPAQEEGFYDISADTPASDTAFDFGGGSDQADAFDLGAPAPTQSSVPVPAASGNYDPTQLQVFSAIAPTLGELVAEIRRSIEYYQGRAADGEVHEILLCGGTAGLKNLDAFLSGELGIPTRVADPFQYAAVTARNYSAEHIRDLAPSFAVATGLAARDMVAVPVAPKAKPAKRGKK
ncbi:MAG: type IV pilus assembly protein PilM [Armatimonadetes bacterium]|nr:type IV pilus assembly protein PilM [Armatimonadota bacterium]